MAACLYCNDVAPPTPGAACPVCFSGGPVPVYGKLSSKSVRGARKAPAQVSPRVSAPAPKCAVCRCDLVNPRQTATRADGSKTCLACDIDARNAARNVTADVVDVEPVAPHPSLVRIACASTVAAPVVSAAVLKIREMNAAKQYTTVAALILGLTPNPDPVRLEVLRLIDENSALRGFMTEQDRKLRDSIGKAALETLGWDPRKVDGPPVAPPSAPLPALPAQREPLKAGDWKGLWERVEAGELSEVDARGFAAAWKGASA